MSPNLDKTGQLEGESSVDASHVLVVDDVLENREILVRRLERYGHRVSTAENGELALGVLAESDIDLVLLDIMMPVMDGYEVLERMKEDGAHSEIPVIVISAVGEMESIVKCILLGADDYLPKPFNPTILKARVSACLERKALRDQQKVYLAALEHEKRKVDDILNAILPGTIAEELKDTGGVAPRRVESAAVLFSDIVGFTSYCDKLDPDVVFGRLEELVAAFESVTAEYSVEKIKTLGDGFMAASGLLGGTENSVLDCARAGEAWIRAARAIEPGWEVRVGIHVGPVVAGIIGTSRYAFDLWGDTVNTASRIESNGKAGGVCFSEAARAALPSSYEIEGSYAVEAKGKGSITIYSTLIER